MDSRSRLQPPLGSGLSWQASRIEEDGSGDNTIFQRVNIPFWATARSLDVIHRPAIVSLAVNHDVTVHRIQMAVNHTMICTCVLIPIGGACRGHIAENALQNVRRILGLFLSDIVRQ